jgi:hypothetical protein
LGFNRERAKDWDLIASVQKADGAASLNSSLFAESKAVDTHQLANEFIGGPATARRSCEILKSILMATIALLA